MFMSKTRKTIEYPVYVKVSDALEMVKKIVKQFRNDSIEIEALATCIGSSNAKSGTFLRKLADLKRYGLIEGRGANLGATELAKRIATHTTETERNQAITEMIFNIPIFKSLYDVFQSNTAPSENDVFMQLINITKMDRAELQPISAEIRKFYIDAMQYINVSEMANQSTYKMMMASPSQQGIPNKPQITQEGISTFITDKINLNLPETIPNLELIKTAVENRIKELKEGKKETSA